MKKKHKRKCGRKRERSLVLFRRNKENNWGKGTSLCFGMDVMLVSGTCAGNYFHENIVL
jgi:hypothetical protein